MVRNCVTQQVSGWDSQAGSSAHLRQQGTRTKDSPGQRSHSPSAHTRQGLHSEGPVPPLAAECSDEATVRLDDTGVQEAWESIKGQDVAQLER